MFKWPEADSNLWTSLAGPSPLQAEQTHLGTAAAGTSADDSKQSSAMEAVIAAEAEDLAAPLYGAQSSPVGTQALTAGTQTLAAGTKSLPAGTQILPAGLAEHNMARQAGKAASP